MFRFFVLENRCIVEFLICGKCLLVNQSPTQRVWVILDVATVAMAGVWSLRIK
jgi:hypothetical protein